MTTAPTSFFDLRALDTTRIAKMLREVALAQLTRLLNEQQPVGLADYLPSTAADLAEHGRATWEKIEFAPILSRTTAPHFSEGAIREKVVNHIEHLVAGNPPYRFPDVLWDLVEWQAWQNPEFMRAVAAEFQHYLERNYLMHPGGAPKVTLAPQSYWLLIALAHTADQHDSSWKGIRLWFARIGRASAEAPAPGLAPPKRANDNQIQAASERLSNHATARLMTKEWADFWDQWLIAHANQKWQMTFKHLDKRLKAAFDGLPWNTVPNTLPERTKPDAKPAVVLAKPDWKNNMPPWLASRP